MSAPMTTPKRPRCRRCGSRDGLGRYHWGRIVECHDLFACGERVGAKGRTREIKTAINGLSTCTWNDDPEGSPLLRLDEVLAVVARKVGR
jgi:hypothetical protein